MFSIIRLIFRIAFLLLVGLLVLAYFTNPTTEDFKQEAKSRIDQQLEQLRTGATMEGVAKMADDVTNNALDKMVTRKNYFIASVFELKMPGGTYRYFGAFRMFYPLQEDNPLQTFFKTAQP